MNEQTTSSNGSAPALAAPYAETCPKGKHSYSRHRLQTISRVETAPGVFAIQIRCKVCGGEADSTEDYNVLSGVFSVPSR